MKKILIGLLSVMLTGVALAETDYIAQQYFDGKKEAAHILAKEVTVSSTLTVPTLTATTLVGDGSGITDVSELNMDWVPSTIPSFAAQIDVTNTIPLASYISASRIVNMTPTNVAATIWFDVPAPTAANLGREVVLILANTNATDANFNGADSSYVLPAADIAMSNIYDYVRLLGISTSKWLVIESGVTSK